MTGQFDRAIAEMKRAVELDPVSPMFHAELGGVYMVARRYDEAIEQIAEHHRNGSGILLGSPVSGLALELKGATNQAIAEYHRAFEVSDDPVVLAFLAHAEAKIGRQMKRARYWLGLRKRLRRGMSPRYAFAVIHLALEEKDQASRLAGKKCSRSRRWPIASSSKSIRISIPYAVSHVFETLVSGNFVRVCKINLVSSSERQ